MPKINAITKALIIAFVVSMELPEAWSDQIHFGGVPLGFFILTWLCFILFGQVLFKSNVVSPGLIGGGAALIITALVGLVRDNIGQYTLKFYVADIFCVMALLAGYAVPRVFGAREATEKLVSLMAIISSIVVIVTYAALFAGLIKTDIVIEGRVVTQSIFVAVGLLIILLPWATASIAFRRNKYWWRPWLFFLTALGTGFVSGTRSILIAVVLAAGLYVIVNRKSLGTAFLLRLACGTIAVGFLVSGGLPQFITFSLNRLDNTQIGEESRYEELTVWWAQMRNDYWAGQGLGSRFVSIVIVEGNPLASAPHVGIVTFLMKGGIPMFLAYVVLPLFVGIYRLLSPRMPLSQRAAAASVLIFIAMGSLSGGWSPLALFAYGMALSSMTAKSKKPSTYRRLPEPILTSATLQYENSSGY